MGTKTNDTKRTSLYRSEGKKEINSWKNGMNGHHTGKHLWWNPSPLYLLPRIRDARPKEKCLPRVERVTSATVSLSHSSQLWPSLDPCCTSTPPAPIQGGDPGGQPGKPSTGSLKDRETGEGSRAFDGRTRFLAMSTRAGIAYHPAWGWCFSVSTPHLSCHCPLSSPLIDETRC